MTSPSSDQRPARGIRPTWIWGGALLIAGQLPAVMGPVGGGPVVPWLGMLVFAAAMVLFAVGRDSVVARRPLGVTALFVVGLLPVATSLLWQVLPFEAIFASGTIDDAAISGSATVSTVLQLVGLAAALVACVQVARAGVVPHAVRWVPLIALAVVAVGQAVATALIQTAGSDVSPIELAGGLSTVAPLAGALGLGITAIVAGVQPRPVAAPPAQIYPPAS